MTEPTWQQRERALRASWTAATSREERIAALTVLLADTLSDATIGEGRALAEEAFELALADGDEVSEANADEAYLCLADVYDELGLDAEKALAAERWEKRFAAAPPAPVFGLIFGSDGSIGVISSPDELE